MAFFDKPLEELQQYRPERTEPADYAEFWETTLKAARSHPLNPQFSRIDVGLDTLETYDVTFNGYGGQPIKGWYLLPKHRSGKLPCIVEYLGYGGGRGFLTDWLLWSTVGFAHLVMDTRGQGGGWSKGDTPDYEPEGAHPQHPGFMTRGILDPKTYYYRRTMTDAVRAVEAAQHAPDVDTDRIGVMGGSQGGGLAISAASLAGESVKLALPNVPFLCHYRHATRIQDTYPYVEISKFVAAHREKVEQVFRTLSYFDGVNFAAHAKCPTLFSVGLMDEICPPSTVYAAYNHWAGEKDIRVYEYSHHEGGGAHHVQEMIRTARAVLGS